MFSKVLESLIELTGYTPQDAQTLSETYPITSQWADEFAKAFYDVLFAYPPTAAVFRPGERPAREQTLKDWYLRVARGDIDEKFWLWQWRVGLIHIPRRVPNDYMLGMMSRVQQLFLQKCMAAWEPEQATRVFLAFKRVTDVVAGLIAEGYMRGHQLAMKELLGFRQELLDRLMEMEVDTLVERLMNLSVKSSLLN
ncbi:MAG: globin [Chloroflexi bacterium]|nr:globin [Chloroflexota bacterium]